jgi:hypothetical protein
LADDLTRRMINSALGPNVTLFSPTQRKGRNWDAQELAEFYRVENALIQGGMRVVTDCGLSDEGDPWFVFSREHDDEPIVHFARIDGQYVIASPAYEGVARGLDFRSMVQELLERHKLSLISSNKEKNSNIHIHPAALLIVLIGAAFFKTPSQANADELRKELGQGQKGDASSVGLTSRFSAQPDHGTWLADFDQMQNDQALVRNLWIVASAAALLTTNDENVPGQAAVNSTGPLFLDENAGSHASLRVPVLSHTAISEQVVSDVPFVSSAKVDETSVHNDAGLNKGAVSAIHGVFGTDYISHPTQNFFSGETSFVNVFTPTPPSLPIKTGHEPALTQFADYPHTIGPASGRDTPTSSGDTQTTSAGKADWATKTQVQSPGAGYHEFTFVADQLSAVEKSAAPRGIVLQEPGSAVSFLNDNKIFVTLQGGDHTPSSSVPLLGVDSSSSSGAKGQKTSTSVSNSETNDANVHDVILTSPDAKAPETLSSADFVKTLSTFLQKANDVHVTIDHGWYVFSDFSASNVAGLSESVTATFSDGSAISIVGQHQMLHDILSHMA